MSKPLDAVDYLADPKKHPCPAVCVLFGDEAFLHREALAELRRGVLGAGDGEFSLTVFEGPRAALADVFEELATRAMFGAERRLVVVEDADDFVTRYRPELEDYVARPSPTGALVLQVKSWPSNTRLFKAVDAAGVAIACTAPTAGKLTRWLAAWAKRVHRVELTGAVAELLVEMIGPELGLLDQAVAKLAVASAPGGRISPETVAQMVGTWRAKTTWDMLDAALDGKPRDALTQLDRLLLAGENPIALLAQISASLRRLAAATRLILQTEASGRRPVLGAALEQAGVKRFVLEKSQQQLRRLGRRRGARLYRWLLQTDLALKGDSRLPPRLVLETLLVRLSAAELK
ncbi:MAG: DNA polymerase III subunit delta [Pirellulales bacterium]|nr:DNA polymerase III subunit delta [Pirellulales bacterium]